MCMIRLKRIIESDDMSNITKEFVNEYIRAIIPSKCPMFYELEKYAFEHKVPIIEPEVAQFLSVLIKIIKPGKILEIGTAIGYSALIMANSYENSQIISIERDENMLEKARKNIMDFNLSHRIKILSGDANDILPSLNEKFDLVFLDAAKGQYMGFFKHSSEMLKKGGIIISDNVLFKGMVASDELVIKRKKTIVKRLRSYLEYINNIEGYTSSILPIGDGVAITYKD